MSKKKQALREAWVVTFLSCGLEQQLPMDTDGFSVKDQATGFWMLKADHKCVILDDSWTWNFFC